MSRRFIFNVQVILLLVYTAKSISSYSPYLIFPSDFFSKPSGLKEMQVIHKWRTVDFDFPSSSNKLAMIRAGLYIPGNSLILDADFWQNGFEDIIFVTLPRFRKGIPATLAKVSSERSLDGSPKLIPYPDWGWHVESNCEGLVSVFRTKVDDCGRLWVLDSGMTNVLHTAEKMCPPKIMVFDLYTDNLIMKYVFPDDVLEVDSLLVTIALDTRSIHCRDTFAYIADVSGFGLIVFDSKAHHSWRVRSNYFYPYPLHGTINVAGSEFDLMDGVVGLALGPIDKYGDRTLYFHSLASLRESKVSASLLRNESNFMSGENKVSKRFFITDEVRPSQSAAQAISDNNVLFFGLLKSNSIACWNTRLPYLSHNLVTVAQNNETLQFPSGIKVVSKNGVEELLVLTSRFQNYILEKTNPVDVNFRILSASISDLIRGTACDRKTQYRSPESYFSLELNSWK